MISSWLTVNVQPGDEAAGAPSSPQPANKLHQVKNELDECFDAPPVDGGDKTPDLNAAADGIGGAADGAARPIDHERSVDEGLVDEAQVAATAPWDLVEQEQQSAAPWGIVEQEQQSADQWQ